MVEAKTILSIIAVYLAYSYYKSSNPIRKPDSPVVETLAGSLRGITSKSRDGREFYEYLGIPYAKPPVGSLRFEPPQPFSKWDGIRDARNYGSICVQGDLRTKLVGGDENCLFLNIFSPKVHSKKKLLPTLVWIHGGFFAYGAGNMYRPEYFMDHDVVLVTINYRLGPIGFLNTGDGVVNGNMALKDQNMALKWMQANIKSFGGDPKQVTIFGESAGAASVHHHVLSPQSRGLFKKAIAQSGTALANWAVREDFAEQAKIFSKEVGCPTENSKAMVDCLKAADALDLIKISYKNLLNSLRDPITIFNPSIEHVKDNAFIIESPLEILRKGTFEKVPFLTGVNSEEGLLTSAALVRDSKLTEMKNNFNVHLPNTLWERQTGPPNLETIQKIKDFYFGKEAVDSVDAFHNWTNMITDKAFGQPAKLAIELHSKHSSEVHAYYYTYKGEFSLADLILATPGKYPAVLEYSCYFLKRWIKKNIFGIEPIHYGAAHFDEVAMLFPLSGRFEIKPGDKDYNMSKIMVKAWVDYASDLKSKPLELDGVSWPTANVGRNGNPLKYMHIDVKSDIIDEPNSKRTNFWNNVKL